MIEVRTTNARGVLVGQSQPMCRWPNTVVEEARAMRAAGATLQSIADHFGIQYPTTVWRWVRNLSRKPHVRVSVKRVKTPTAEASSSTNPRQD